MIEPATRLLRRVIQLLASLLMACGNTALATDGDIEILAKGFKNARGQAMAKLFLAGDDVLGPGRWQVATLIKVGQAQLNFGPLPPGDYAVVVFHDENTNGRIDHNFLHLPSETLGFSNAFRPGPRTGLPSFDKLRIQHGATHQRLEINLN